MIVTKSISVPTVEEKRSSVLLFKPPIMNYIYDIAEGVALQTEADFVCFEYAIDIVTSVEVLGFLSYLDSINYKTFIFYYKDTAKIVIYWSKDET